MKNLSKISFFSTVIGIACLFILSQYVQPEQVSIGSVSDASLGKIVSVNGVISNMSSSDSLFFLLSDTTGTVHVVVFENVARKLAVELKESYVVVITGKISLYKNKYEIIAESVKIV